MAKLIQFDLVSPEKSLVSVEANEINIPGSEGDFSAMSDHAPIITTLRPGFINILTADKEEQYFVTGGFAEVSAEARSVLAEKAVVKDDLSREVADKLIMDAKLKHEQVGSDATAKYYSDLEVALSDI